VVHVIIHRMFSLPVSLPVRGADGLAKRAVYGGVERQRLSSQSVKAHLRNATGLNSSMADLAKELGTEMSVRSALIGPRKIATELKRREFTEDQANLWAERVMALFQTGKEKAPAKAAKKSKKAKAEDDETDVEATEEDASETATASAAGRQILTLGEKEIAALVDVASALVKAKVPASEMRDLIEKTSKQKKPSKASTGCACRTSSDAFARGT
jgi:CT1975-like protein